MNYKGYSGTMEWDDEAQIFHGRLDGLRAIITFEGDNETEAAQAFHDSVDDYLEWCAELKETPETPAQEEITLQVPLELSRKMRDAAQKSGQSWEDWLLQTLTRQTEQPILR